MYKIREDIKYGQFIDLFDYKFTSDSENRRTVQYNYSVAQENFMTRRNRKTEKLWANMNDEICIK